MTWQFYIPLLLCHSTLALYCCESIGGSVHHTLSPTVLPNRCPKKGIFSLMLAGPIINDWFNHKLCFCFVWRAHLIESLARSCREQIFRQSTELVCRAYAEVYSALNNPNNGYKDPETLLPRTPQQVQTLLSWSSLVWLVDPKGGWLAGGVQAGGAAEDSLTCSLNKLFREHVSGAA